MRLTLSPLLVLAWMACVVLGFDLAAALVTRLAHVPYSAFALPDFGLFIAIGFVVRRSLPTFAAAIFYVILAALIEATAGRALATALDAETPPPPTTAVFLALETVAVAGVTAFWGAIGVAIATLAGRRP